jgi:hypothetical protein
MKNIKLCWRARRLAGLVATILGTIVDCGGNGRQGMGGELKTLPRFA